MAQDQPLPAEEAEERYEELRPHESDQRDGPRIGKWIAVLGSSALFHLLLLILLSMIIIYQPEEDREEVTLKIPEQQEKEQERITRRKINPEIKTKSEVQTPQVQTETQVDTVESQLNKSVGQSLKFKTESPTDKLSERSIALGGGGGGGAFGRDVGGTLTEQGGGSAVSRKAVKAALTWLAKHQAENGKWDADNYDQQCPKGNKCKVAVNGGIFDTGVTGLSLLAFLGAGYTPQSDTQLAGIDVGNVVQDGLRWLKQQQRDNGAFDSSHKQMYNHALATMAFAEAYGMTAAPRLRGVAQKGVDFLQNAQNRSGGNLLGWRYEANSGDNDTSVTGWCAMALKSADIAGLETSEKAMQGALRWVKKVTNQKGLTGYNSKITSRDQAYNRRAMTPVGMLIRMFASEKLGKRQLMRVKQGADFLVRNLPQFQERKKSQIDYYYWYYGGLTLYMFAGPGTEFENTGYWEAWNQPMQKAVLAGQQTRREGHEMGSWDPVSRWSDHQSGRVYTTAINTLTLEVYYRYSTALFQ